MSPQTIRDFYQNNHLIFYPKFSYNDQLLQLLYKMIQKDPMRRITSQKLINDPFIVQYLLLCNN